MSKIPGLAIAIMSKKKEDDDSSIDEGRKEEFESLSKDILKAIKDGDSSALASSLQAFIEGC